MKIKLFHRSSSTSDGRVGTGSPDLTGHLFFSFVRIIEGLINGCHDSLNGRIFEDGFVICVLHGLEPQQGLFVESASLITNHGEMRCIYWFYSVSTLWNQYDLHFIKLRYLVYQSRILQKSVNEVFESSHTILRMCNFLDVFERYAAITSSATVIAFA